MIIILLQKGLLVLVVVTQIQAFCVPCSSFIHSFAAKLCVHLGTSQSHTDTQRNDKKRGSLINASAVQLFELVKNRRFLLLTVHNIREPPVCLVWKPLKEPEVLWGRFLFSSQIFRENLSYF
jgi:hypothetical protein